MLKKIIIKDYDDSILCTNVIVRESKKQKVEELNVFITIQLKIELEILEIEAIKYIKFLLSQGSVYIVTNSETGWVELSCRKFLPNLWNILKDVPILSAIDIFKSNFPNIESSQCYWKYYTMKYILDNEMKKSVLISIGDSDHEKEASILINKDILNKNDIYNLPIYNINIKMIENPSIKELIRQMKIIMLNFNHLVSDEENFLKKLIL